MAYLSTSKILSYNAALNFIVLKRGIGKSFGFKMKCIDNYLNGKGKFIWLRRTKEEIKITRDKFLTDIAEKYPDHVLQVKGYTVYCDGAPCGDLIALSRTIGHKSAARNDVYTLVYDEFIPQSGYCKYIPDEPTVFASFLTSVFRDRPIHAYCLGNMESTVTPYNLYYNIPPFKGNKYIPDRKILIFTEYNNDVLEDNYNDTDLQKILKGTQYYDYAFLNESLLDDNHYIAKLPKNAKQIFIINIEGKDIGVYVDWETSRIFLSRKCDLTDARKLCFRANNLREGYFLFTKNMPQGKSLSEILRIGQLFYTDLETKQIAEPFILYIS